MKILQRFFLAGAMAALWSTGAFADYTKGTTMFQIYGGGAGLGGHYRFAGDRDEAQYADGGGLIGGQFLYFFNDSPSLAAGVDISHAGFGDHNTFGLLANQYTSSSADSTMGAAVLRLSYPKGPFRPYVQGGLGAHHTSLELKSTPVTGFAWSDTGTMEQRDLYDDGHLGLALEGAIGMHIYFTERFFVGAELKIVDLFGKDFTPTAAGSQQNLGNTRGSVSETGLGFMFGLGF